MVLRLCQRIHSYTRRVKLLCGTKTCPHEHMQTLSCMISRPNVLCPYRAPQSSAVSEVVSGSRSNILTYSDNNQTIEMFISSLNTSSDGVAAPV